jgi:hypothetical protein
LFRCAWIPDNPLPGDRETGFGTFPSNAALESDSPSKYKEIATILNDRPLLSNTPEYLVSEFARAIDH